MQKFNQYYRIVLYINLFINAVFCALCPPILLALLGKFLCGRFLWNRGVIAVFVLLGAVIGGYSCISYLRKARSLTAIGDPSDKGSPYRLDHKQNPDNRSS